MNDNAVRDVTIAEAKALIAENKVNSSFVILDIRTPDEFSQGRIFKAVNLNFYLDDFAEKIAALDKDSTYLLYCRSGNRSQMAIEIMKNAGITKIYHMKEGYIAWEQ
jgi:rhodanese-related sulfurtransferase